MGLDGLELVMAVEERFGITITDEEAQETSTAGEMLNLVLSKIQVADETGCLTQQAFHLFRRASMTLFRISRREFRPDTLLNDVVPKERRREKWRELQAAVGASTWPELVRPRALVMALSVLCWIVFVGTFFYVRVFDVVTVIEAAMAASLAGWLSAVATRPWRIAFASGRGTAGDMARYIVAKQRQLVRQDAKSLTEESAWETLREVIIEQTAVTNFTKDSRFVKDMGID